MAISSRQFLLDDQYRISGISYEDWYAGMVRSIETKFSDYTTVDGLTYPKSKYQRVADGAWGASRVITRVVVNGKVPAVFRHAE